MFILVMKVALLSLNNVVSLCSYTFLTPLIRMVLFRINALRCLLWPHPLCLLQT